MANPEQPQAVASAGDPPERPPLEVLVANLRAAGTLYSFNEEWVFDGRAIADALMVPNAGTIENAAAALLRDLDHEPENASGARWLNAWNAMLGEVANQEHEDAGNAAWAGFRAALVSVAGSFPTRGNQSEEDNR